MRALFTCLLLCLLQGIAAPAFAQSVTMPAWVVPVLRLVSTTHVEPTTGVVLSADGLVLVEADFASPGDEIIVLDGGTDIIRNGRPAHLESAFPEFGLEVLRVEGLHRNGAPLAPLAPKDGSSLTLRAFPPAEQIAEGAPPVSVATTISVFSESGTPSLPADNPLPNVTGPLLDACGDLVGFSLANGLQSMTPTPATQYRWTAALRHVFAELKLPVTASACSAAPAAVEQTPPAEPEQPSELEIIDQPARTEPAIDEGEPAPADEISGEPAADTVDETEPPVEILPPFEEDDVVDQAETAMPPEKTPARLWPWLAGALLMLTGGIVLHRLRRRVVPASLARDDGVIGVETQGQSPDGDHPDETWPTPGPASHLVLRGSLANGQVFEVSTRVSADAVNVEIGRGNAELTIDSSAVSRRHARLNGSRGALTLTDLGSSNGSSINGVPCLEGEIMYLEPGDAVILGDARFTVAIEDAPVAEGDR